MAYNKAREEYKWKIWKEMEEKKMRELRVSEDVIKQLREWDWLQFKKERNFQERQITDSDLVEIHMQDLSFEEKNSIVDIQSLFQELQESEVMEVLERTDEKSLNIVLLKMQGFTTDEIASQLDMTPKSIYRRMDRLKEKLKKIKIKRGKLKI